MSSDLQLIEQYILRVAGRRAILRAGRPGRADILFTTDDLLYVVRSLAVLVDPEDTQLF